MKTLAHSSGLVEGFPMISCVPSLSFPPISLNSSPTSIPNPFPTLRMFQAIRCYFLEGYIRRFAACPSVCLAIVSPPLRSLSGKSANLKRHKSNPWTLRFYLEHILNFFDLQGQR